MKYKISIIIPIYNAEKYIEECLESIFGQLPVQVEIILINDGTPDKSIDIVKSKYDSWLSKDQIVLLEQENAGPGAARNSGLAIARGEYIGFLDSDDIIFENYFSLLIETIRTSQTDIVEFGFQRFNELQDISRDEYKSLYDFSGQHNIKDIRSKIFSVGLWFPWTRI